MKAREGPEVEFVVCYPWGTGYIRELRAALRQLAVPTMNDPLTDGDSDGFFVASDKRSFVVARRLIRATQSDFAAANSCAGFDELIDALADAGAHEIAQDWKHLTWEIDMVKLAFIGVQLKMIATRDTRAGEEFAFRVRRHAKHGVQGRTCNP
jgi:hypothetical protein